MSRQVNILFGKLSLFRHYTARVVSAQAHRARKNAKKSLRSLRRVIIRPIFVLPARRLLRRRIPIALITGTKGKTTTTRMLAHILAETGHIVGYASTDGVVVAGEPIVSGDSSGYAGAARVLQSISITAAVLETARGDILRNGLYLDRCDVAALLNVGRDHIGIDGIETVEEMATLKRKVIDTARNRVVLNADDPLCRNLIGDFPARLTTVFSCDARCEAVKRHLANGGVAFCLEKRGEPRIVRLEGSIARTVVAIANLPSAWGGHLRHNIANAMAAAALADGMGIDPGEAGVALASFEISVEHSPGRFNIISEHPNLVIVDRAVSPPAVEALVASVRNIDGTGRRLCMMTSVGNRPSAHFTELAGLLAQVFDHFICYEIERYRRGRAQGEIAELLRAGLREAGVRPQCIDIGTGRDDALRLLLQLAKPGDVLVILGLFSRAELLHVRNLLAPHLIG